MSRWKMRILRENKMRPGTVVQFFWLGSFIALVDAYGDVSAPGSRGQVIEFVNVAEQYHFDKAGRTDNYAKLRAWADDVNRSGGGNYYFPRGTYLIDPFKTIDPKNEHAVTETPKYDRETDTYLAENIKLENIDFRNCSRLKIFGDQAKFSVKGKFHREANYKMAGGNYSTSWHLTPLRFIDSTNIHLTGFEIDGNIQDTTKDEKLMEWQGHGLIFSGCEQLKLENVIPQNVIQNAVIRDSLSKADTKVTIDLRSNENQSIFSNLGCNPILAWAAARATKTIRIPPRVFCFTCMHTE